MDSNVQFLELGCTPMDSNVQRHVVEFLEIGCTPMDSNVQRHVVEFLEFTARTVLKRTAPCNGSRHIQKQLELQINQKQLELQIN